jgi:hypothetical protein
LETADEIPEAVRALLDGHIDSVVQAEVLLLLYANPARTFDAAQVGRELRIEPAGAEEQLSKLTERGMLASGGGPPGTYHYSPQTPQMDLAVAGLARAYADRRVAVISRIYAKPDDPLRSFADAFRIRKDTESG